MPQAILSMTGFARQEDKDSYGSFQLELRSVNHRYLEYFARLPDGFRYLDTVMREQVNQHLNRGKIELTLNFLQEKIESEIQINANAVSKLAQACETIKTLVPVEPLRMIDILNYPGVIQHQELDKIQLEKRVLSLLKNALQELTAHRAREGTALKQCIEERLTQMQMHIEEVAVRLPEVQEQLRLKLSTRLAQLQLENDTARVEQEIALALQKMDVAEELDRLRTHIDELHTTLNQGGVVGRKLDFLLQELNREANTLGSKSVDAAMTTHTVALKVLIEQIREQVQNLE